MVEERLNQDLKRALLAGEKFTVSTLRTLKSVILYEKVATGAVRDQALNDGVVFGILKKEAKKRQESADLYTQGGSIDRAQSELAEKAIIEQYLPAQMDELQVKALVEEAIRDIGRTDLSAMGIIISAVKDSAAGAADGVVIARLVKERLQQ